MYDVIVIGAGQAGLAAGYHLQRANQRFVILEAGAQPSGSWARYYDSLRLFSPVCYSSLPGLPFPGKPDAYPTRDEVVAYLTQYAEHFQLPVMTDTRVESVEKRGDTFRVRTHDNREFHSRSIIAATGAFSKPNLPDLPGQGEFMGKLLHSSSYYNPAPFAGKRVLVVGAGNSAVQIAVELARTADVTLTSRELIRFRPQRILGRDVHFWVKLTGVDTRTTKHGAPKGLVGVLDTGVYQSALATGKPDYRPLFKHFTSEGVVWADDSFEAVDAVIYATGYRPNLDYLADLGALDAAGQPLQQYGVSQTTPGLYFVGLSWQRSHASATLRGVGADAAYVIRHWLAQQQQPERKRFSFFHNWRGALRCCPAPISA